MSKRHRYVQSWISECTQDENRDPDFPFSKEPSHKRRRVTQSQRGRTKHVATRVEPPTRINEQLRGRKQAGGGRGSVSRGARETQSAVFTVTNHMASGHTILDDSTTPKASQFRSKRGTITDECDEAEGSHSPSKRSKSTTSGASRSSSPTKPNVLRSLQQPIRTESIDNVNLPESASVLVRQLRRYAAGFETVPQGGWRKIVTRF